MPIDVRCPHCNNLWTYKGHAVMATCTSCYRKVKVRSLPDHIPTLKAPAGVKKLLKKPLEKLPDGATILGETQEQTTGRVQTQTFTVPAAKIPIPVKHPRRAFSPEELCAGHVCHHCHMPIKYPKMGFWVDGICMHRPCLVDEAIQQTVGDLLRASQEWDIPIEALQKRAAILKQKGKLNF